MVKSIITNQQEVRLDVMQNAIAKAKEMAVANLANVEALKQLLNLVDLTTLEGKDTPEKVSQLCLRAKKLSETFENLPTVAAICVYPSLVRTAKDELRNTAIKLASVAGGFPSGQIPIELKLEEVKYAISQGADEIDMVISRGTFLMKDYQTVYDEIQSIKGVCGTARLKVILETGELETLENIRLASDLAIEAGADFIKTSTGKVSQGASLEAIWIMLQAIKDSGKKIGIKPSGGISTAEDALCYFYLVQNELGDKWSSNELMRFGASSLAGNILYALTRDEQSLSYFKSNSGY